MQLMTPEVIKTVHVDSSCIRSLSEAKQQIEQYKHEATQYKNVRFGYQVVFKLAIVQPFPNCSYSFPNSMAINQFFKQMPMNLKPKLTAYDPQNRTMTFKGFFIDFLLGMMIQDFNNLQQRKIFN